LICEARKRRGVHCAVNEFQESSNYLEKKVFIKISIGYQHICGIEKTTKKVFCQMLGSPNNEGLSNGISIMPFPDAGQAEAPKDVAFKSIDAGQVHTCGLALDGELYCWGAQITDEIKQNWRGFQFDYDQAIPPEGSFVAVTSGRYHSCALRSTGKVVCWGNNASGQAAPPDKRFIALAAAGNSTCGLTTTHELICWGDRRFHNQ
jgi:alpha-tubulin suppressor-like RCC1 family protein